MSSDLFNLYWNLGRTFNFFRPWFVPRNQKDTVHRGSALSTFFGRRRREIEIGEMELIIEGRNELFMVNALSIRQLFRVQANSKTVIS